jgi:histidinol dehydrogenase
MTAIKMLRLDSVAVDFEQQLQARLAWDASDDLDIHKRVLDIIADVKKRGDKALLEYTNRFDGTAFKTADELELDRAALQHAWDTLPSTQAIALQTAADRVRAYAEHQKLQSWQFTEIDGTVLGQKVTALDKAGLYVPGGKAAYPSSVLMNAIPAKVAGVGELIMVVPTPRGETNALVLAAAHVAGVDRVFTIGGAQAVAALAYGTESIRAVDKIVGPGNAWVAEAKRQVFGLVGIDSIAGPSEICVYADSKNNPAWIAADLLSQAEHDKQAQSILIAQSGEFASKVEAEIATQLSTLPRAEIARRSWQDHGGIIIAPDTHQALAAIHFIAPEHLELAVDNPEALLPEIRHAGAIFLGRMTPEAIGDYIAGPSHVLPTSRTARFSSVLSVTDFIKRTSIIGVSEVSYGELATAGITLANAEGLGAHALSMQVRLKK